MTTLTTLWIIVSFFIILIYYFIVDQNRHIISPSEEEPKEESKEEPKENSTEEDKIFLSISNGTLTSKLYEDGFENDPLEICPDKDKPLKLLIAVMTKASRKARRMTIRKTWGHYGLRYDISIIFIYGSPESDLTYEREIYNDILISKNIDREINNGLKTISLMEFIALYCPLIEYVLKTNDNVFVNIPIVLDIIREMSPSMRKIYGHLQTGESPRFISNTLYNKSVLPDYLNGDSYLFPAGLSREFYVEALNSIFIPVEDVFITGIIAGKLGISLVGKSEFSKNRFFDYKDFVYAKANSVMRQYKLWEKINVD